MRSRGLFSLSFLCALVLNLTVTTLQADELFYENFETGDLTQKGWTGQLNQHDRWDTDQYYAHSGSYAARYDCYNDADTGDMISPVIDMSGTENNVLTFYVRNPRRTVNYWFFKHTYFNHLYVYVSNDGGNAWTQLDHITDSSSYSLKTYNLDGIITPTGNMRIKFKGQGGNADSNSYDTFVDDVRITGDISVVENPVPTRTDVLKHWAPQVYHDTRNDSPLGYRFYESQDMISKVDFDGTWYAGDNWENFPRNGDYSSLVGNAYCSFVETETHFYLGYQYFHATDDAVIAADRHENDMEDVYICIEKSSDLTEYGTFKALISNRHGDMQKYTASNMEFTGNHPRIFISSNGDVLNDSLDTGAHGHGIEAYHTGSHNTDDDAIVYNVADTGQAPTECGGGAFTHHYDYGLVEIDELWSRRLKYDHAPFKGYGSFTADGQDSGAHAPWNNQYFKDPAAYFTSNFSGITSSSYTHNPYYNVTSTSAGNPVVSLEDGWNNADIGSVSQAGYAYAVRETLTVAGAGSDI